MILLRELRIAWVEVLIVLRMRVADRGSSCRSPLRMRLLILLRMPWEILVRFGLLLELMSPILRVLILIGSRVLALVLRMTGLLIGVIRLMLLVESIRWHLLMRLVALLSRCWQRRLLHT